MPGRKKRPAKKASAKARRKSRRGLRLTYLDESDPEIIISTHNFDCTMNDSPSAMLVKRPRRSDVQDFEMKIKMKKGKGKTLDVPPMDNLIDVIFLTRKSRDLWDKYVPTPTRPAPTGLPVVGGSGARSGVRRTTGGKRRRRGGAG